MVTGKVLFKYLILHLYIKAILTLRLARYLLMWELVLLHVVHLKKHIS